MGYSMWEITILLLFSKEITALNKNFGVDPGGQMKIAIVHFFCSCTICFAVVPCILQLCFLFSRCAKTMYYS